MTYNRIKHVKSVAKELVSDLNYNSFKDFTAEDIEFISMETQCNYAGVCKILGLELPAELGPVLG